MNDDLRRSAEQRVRIMDNDNRNDAFSKFYAHQNKVNAIVTLEDVENMKKLVSDAEAFNRAVSESFKNLDGKEYKKMAESFRKMQEYMKGLTNESNDASKNAEIIAKMVEDLESADLSKLDKGVTVAMNNLINGNQEVINMANNYKKIMKESSETFGKNLMNNLDNVADRIVKLSNAFNLQKLVTGGASFKDLQAMQGNVKVSMNIDDSGFMGLQRELVSQNKEFLDRTGEAYLTFEETSSYLSSIKEYSLKNYNQATSLYKQVVIGNKYLSLSNQSLSSMVKATNQMADDSYMNRQMALLAALGSDSGLSEDISGLADFASTNLAGVMGRYSNGEQMIKESLAIKATNEAYLGSNSALYDSMMSEIMNTNNFANLSEKTQNLIAMSGMAPTLQQMMQSGHVDMNRFMYGFNEGLNRFANQAGGKDSMELYGYGDWVTAMGSYDRNRENYLKSISEELGVLDGVDFSDVKSMDEALQKIAEQNVNKSFWEKFSDKVFTMFGIQDQNWTQLNGYVQMIQTLVSGTIAAVNVVQAGIQLGISKQLSVLTGQRTLDSLGGGKFSGISSWLGSSSLGAKTFGGAAMSNGAALGGGALLAGGVVVGISDAVKMQGSTGKGWVADSARGFFLGTGSANNTEEENAGATLGNAAKWAAIGAGIGTFIAPGVGTIVGGLIGGAAGIFGSLWGNTMEDNTEAVKENTKAYSSSNDAVVTKSYINQIFRNKGEGSAGISYGVGAGGTSNTGGYPWSISSPFGNRTLPNGDRSFHNGVDWGIAEGTPVGAPVKGTIVFSQDDGRNTYYNDHGLTYEQRLAAGGGVNLQGDNGILYQFWHLSKAGVKKGQTVSAGQTIGLSGNTGYSTGAHLHFGTKVNGSWVNPLPYASSGLFNADGQMFNAALYSNNNATNISSSPDLKQYLSKESVFNSSAGATRGVGAAPTISTEGLATSKDIGDLISTIKQINENQNEQRDFMRALAGKNTFVYGRE